MVKVVRQQLLELPRPIKKIFVFSLDALLIFLSVCIAYYLRVDEWLNPFVQTNEHTPSIAILVGWLVALPVFFLNGAYRAVSRHISAATIVHLVKGWAFFAAAFVSVFTFYGVTGVPRTIGIIQPFVLLVFVLSTRLFIARLLGVNRRFLRKKEKIRRVVVYGAGVAGRQLVKLLEDEPDIMIVGFIDDDKTLQGADVAGLPVFARGELHEIANSFSVAEILLAIPSASHRRRRELIDYLRKTNLGVRTLPSYTDLVNGQVSISDLRNLSIEEILGRDSVEADAILMGRDLFNQIVMVTGAGGSIGSELCRQIILQKPQALILFERSEVALYEICNEIQKLGKDWVPAERCKVIPILGSVIDTARVSEVIKRYHVDTIYHAAAYKHVPLVEQNSKEGIRNNVFGTLAIANAACKNGVKKFVLISTDKAVRPTSIMGASKRIAELGLQALAVQQGPTLFAIVRFGNVLNSSGSVVPLFRQQIATGGPITLTHPDVTRYFMTISEAAELVVQAAAMTSTSDNNNTNAPIYLLDMGEPIRIADLAKQMVTLSGLTIFHQDESPDGDIEIKITGLRPGEKLFEELLIGGTHACTSHPKIYVADEDYMKPEDLELYLARISNALEHDGNAELHEALIEQFEFLEINQRLERVR